MLKDRIKSFVRNDFFTVFVFDVLGKIIMGIETILIVRVLSEQDYAMYTNFAALAGIILTVIGTSISIPFVAYSSEQIARGSKKIYSVYVLCCMFMCTVAALFLLAVKPLSGIYGIGVGLGVLSILYGVAQSLVKLNQTFFQAYEKYRKSGIILNIKNVFTLAMLVAVYLITRSVTVTFIATVAIIATTLAFGAGWLWIYRIKDPDGASLKESGNAFFKLIKESAWLIAYLIVQNFFASVCLVIMNAIGTDSDIANFGVANKYYSILMLFLSSMQTVLRVKTCKPEFAEDALYRKKYVSGWIKKALPLAGGTALIAAAVAPWIFPILNGGKYETSVQIFQILMIAMTLGYVFSVCTVMLMGMKRYKTLFSFAMISLLVSATCCYFLYPLIGILSTAVAIVVSNFLLNLSSFIVVMRCKDKPRVSKWQ